MGFPLDVGVSHLISALAWVKVIIPKPVMPNYRDFMVSVMPLSNRLVYSAVALPMVLRFMVSNHSYLFHSFESLLQKKPIRDKHIGFLVCNHDEQ